MKSSNLIIVSSFLLLVLGSCEQDFESNHTETKSRNALSKRNSKTINDLGEDFWKNSSNNYDSVGQMHNDGLDYIRLEMTSWNAPCADLNDSIFSLTTSFMVDNYGSNSEDVNAILEIVDSWENEDIDTGYIVNVVSSSNLSSAGKDYTLQIMRLTNNYTDTMEVDLVDKITGIKLVEADIISDTTISPVEKGRLLAGASVARYSAYYSYIHHDDWPVPGVEVVGFLWGTVLNSSVSDWLSFMMLANREEGDLTIQQCVIGAIAISAFSYYLTWYYS